MFKGFETFKINTGEVEIFGRKKGEGEPVLLLHGYPQTHHMWHKIAPRLAEKYTVILTDLRGYGESSHPRGETNHSNYSKRKMAEDQVNLMKQLGYNTFNLIGHDRGARVSHRLLLDYPEIVNKCVLMDIAPTYDSYISTDKSLATAYYHWFFMLQPYDLPERLIGANPEYYLKYCLNAWSRNPDSFSEEALKEYIKYFTNHDIIHSTCEDYRAAGTIDLEHDEADRSKKVECPLLVLWGGKGFVGNQYDVLALWRERGKNVDGKSIPCGHFIPEEAPEETYHEIINFLSTKI